MSTENKLSVFNMLSWRVVTFLSALFSVMSLLPGQHLQVETNDATENGKYLLQILIKSGWVGIIEMWSTLWSYQLLQKHLLIYSTKMHLNDFHAPPLPSSHTDIWYLVAYNPEICLRSWKTTSRKKVRDIGSAQIAPFSDAHI